MTDRAALVALAALVLAHIATGTAWIFADTLPAGQEQANHLRLAQRIALDLRPALERADRVRAFGEWLRHHRRDGTRSTLVHTACVPLVLATGDAADRALPCALGALCLTALAFGTYALARAYVAPAAAAGGAALALAGPGVWGAARHFAMDLPLASGLAVFAAFAAREPPWLSPRRAFVMGMAGGALCLVKAQAAIWVALVVLPSLGRSLIATGGVRPLAARAILFAAGAALGSSPFWAGDAGEIADLVREHLEGVENPSDVPDRWTVTAWTFYAHEAWSWLGPPVAAALAAGVVHALATRRAPVVLVLWVTGSYLVFSLFGVKWGRFLLPALPALCALAAVGIARWPRTVGRAVLALVLVLAAVIEGRATFGADLPDWLRLPGYVRAPRVGRWDHAVATLAARCELAAPGLGARALRIGIEGAPDWTPDDFTRLEIALARRFRRSVIASRIERFREFSPVHLERYDAARADLDLVVWVALPRSSSRPDALPWAQALRIDGDPLHPGSELGGPPRRLSAHIDAALVVGGSGVGREHGPR